MPNLLDTLLRDLERESCRLLEVFVTFKRSVTFSQHLYKNVVVCGLGAPRLIRRDFARPTTQVFALSDKPGLPQERG
jgi:hypothetical protein